MRTPVDDAAALVDEPLVVKLAERLAHGAGAALVHREALVIPIAGGAELFELIDDVGAVELLPRPDLFQKAIPILCCNCF